MSHTHLQLHLHNEAWVFLRLISLLIKYTKGHASIKFSQAEVKLHSIGDIHLLKNLF